MTKFRRQTKFLNALYSSGEHNSKIYAVSLSHPMEKPKVVISWRNLSNVKSMAVSDNYLFFVNSANKENGQTMETIERMSLSGSGRVIKIDRDIDALRSIKIFGNRLYFADSKKIASVNFNGGDRKVHIININPTDFIVTKENVLYWLDARKQAIMTTNEETGALEKFIRRPMTSISDSALVLYSADSIRKDLPTEKPAFCESCGENALCFAASKICKCSPGYIWIPEITDTKSQKRAEKSKTEKQLSKTQIGSCINQIEKSLFLTKKRVFNTFGKDVVNMMLGANFSIYRVPTELDYDIEIPVVAELEGNGEAIAVSNGKDIYSAFKIFGPAPKFGPF